MVVNAALLALSSGFLSAPVQPSSSNGLFATPVVRSKRYRTGWPRRSLTQRFSAKTRRSCCFVNLGISFEDRRGIPVQEENVRHRKRMPLPWALVTSKPKASSIALVRQNFLSGEGISSLEANISSTVSYRVKGPKVRSQMAGTAIPDDAVPGFSTYTPNFTDESFLLKIRALCFYLWTYAVALPLFVVMVAVQPIVLLFDKKRRKAQHFLNRIWASLTTLLFYKTEFVGLENLPSPDKPAVYVANHQSFLDIYTLFFLDDHLSSSVKQDCLKKCIELVKNGVPVLFFPEGTRTSDGKMGAFKKGAFTIATKGKVPVIPIALIGTGRLMPNGLESTLRPGKVIVVIHPPLQGGNADELCNLTRDVIGQTLLMHGMPVL